tara:strand:+ start:1315 stop:1866 length:552 start_codon:yes stop_codon:yes gene_type:complete
MTENFEYTAGEHIATDKHWLPPNIKTFTKFLNQELLPTMPDKYEGYLVGSFPKRSTNDIDIFIIGKPTDEVALWIINLYNKSLNDYKQLIDVAIFEDLTVFQNYDLFNKTKDPKVLNYSDMYKPYDTVYINGKNTIGKYRKVTKISDVLFKHHTSRELPNRKFLTQNFYDPVNLLRFNQVFNV